MNAMGDYIIPIILKPDLVLDSRISEEQAYILTRAALLMTTDVPCDQYIIGLDTYIRKQMLKSNNIDKMKLILEWLDKVLLNIESVQVNILAKMRILQLCNNRSFLACNDAINIIEEILKALDFSVLEKKKIFIKREEWIQIYHPLLESGDAWIDKVLEYLTAGDSILLFYKAPFYNHSVNRFFKVIIRFTLREYPALEKNKARLSAIHIPDEAEITNCYKILRNIIENSR